MNSMMNNTNSNRLSLSSKRVLENAVSEIDDSPPSTSSPKNTNRSKLDQKLGDVKKIKIEIDDDDDRNESMWMEPGDNWNDFKMESKIDPMDVKIKGEPMSPPSSSDSQALVKSELKLEPVANTTDKKKKCSKLTSTLMIISIMTLIVFLS